MKRSIDFILSRLFDPRIMVLIMVYGFTLKVLSWFPQLVFTGIWAIPTLATIGFGFAIGFDPKGNHA